jgi:hypothetical protein
MTHLSVTRLLKGLCTSMCRVSRNLRSVQRLRAGESSRQATAAPATTARPSEVLSPLRGLLFTTGGVGLDGVTTDGVLGGKNTGLLLPAQRSAFMLARRGDDCASEWLILSGP